MMERIVADMPWEFIEQASMGPARYLIDIDQISSVIHHIGKRIADKGLDFLKALHLTDISIVCVCPSCNAWCSPYVLRNASDFASDDRAKFERILNGRCANDSCSSEQYEMFWCPDLHPDYLAELRSRGIQVDPNMQRERDPMWRPSELRGHEQEKSKSML